MQEKRKAYELEELENPKNDVSNEGKTDVLLNMSKKTENKEERYHGRSEKKENRHERSRHTTVSFKICTPFFQEIQCTILHTKIPDFTCHWCLRTF